MKKIIFAVILLFAALSVFVIKCRRTDKAPKMPEAEKYQHRAENLKDFRGSVVSADKEKPGNNRVSGYAAAMDASGNTLWSFSMKGEGIKWAEYAAETSAGDIIFFTRDITNGGEKEKVLLVKTRRNGGIIWEKVMSEKNGFTGAGLAQDIPGGYLIAGRVFSPAEERYDYYIARTDKEGGYMDIKTFSGIYCGWGYRSVLAEDGNFVSAGQTDAPAAGSDVFYITKTGARGKTMWVKKYGEDKRGTCYDAAACVNGDVIAAGAVSSSETGESDIYAIRVDSKGDCIWARTFKGRGYEEAYSVSPAGDGNYLLAGTTLARGKRYYDAYAIKITPSGDKIWEKVFGGPGDDAIYWAAPLKDGGFILAGASSE